MISLFIPRNPFYTQVPLALLVFIIYMRSIMQLSVCCSQFFAFYIVASVMLKSDWKACHDYVQWIFPTDEASMFNSAAPLLSPELAAICRRDPKIQENMDSFLSEAMHFFRAVQSDGETLMLVSYKFAGLQLFYLLFAVLHG